MKPKNNIGKEAALKLFDSKWWEGKSAREITKFQLFTAELCCPFDVFHEAIEESLGRSVWTHEFGLDYDGLCLEFLGEKDAPTFDEILNLIPEEKMILISAMTFKIFANNN